jgi:hypothetical protein
MKQKKEPMTGSPPDPNDPTPTDHDYERARDIVAELKRLGVWNPPS